MSTMTGTVRAGKIEVEAPPGYAEGTQVSVLILPVQVLFQSDAPASAEETQRVLGAMARFEAEFPVDENGEDLSRIASETAAWEKASFDSNAEQLRRLPLVGRASS